MTCVQETETSLRHVQMRMAEAEKRMIQDDILSDDMLMVASGEFFKPSNTALHTAHLVVNNHVIVCR